MRRRIRPDVPLKDERYCRAADTAQQLLLYPAHDAGSAQWSTASVDRRSREDAHSLLITVSPRDDRIKNWLIGIHDVPNASARAQEPA